RLKLHCRRVSLFYHRILQNAVVASTKDATGKKRGGGIAVERQGMLPISVISANVVSVLMLSVSVVNANVAVLFSLYPLLFTKHTGNGNIDTGNTGLLLTFDI
ncbi:MAG: hypothetical protein IKJ37_07550, partial [Kiritimatiellae bacterium]|nr:hypothetical protein [Kiritimatiellia bacterium]